MSHSILVHATLAPYGAPEPRKVARPHSAQIQRRLPRPDSAHRNHSAVAVAALVRPASATAASRSPMQLTQSSSISPAQQAVYAQAERMHAQFQPAAYQPLSPSQSTPQRRPRPASARPASAARGRSKSPIGSHRTGSPVRGSALPLLVESSESRLHHLSLQCLHACWTREWPKLVSLRIECLAMAKLISGPSSPAVHLARLALAEAYLRSNSWAQAVEHARNLPQRFEAEMEYAQGSFDAHMLLGRAYFGLSRDIGAGFVSADAGLVSGSAAAAAAEAARALAQSARHFSAAHAVSQRPAAEFFKHTTIREPTMQRKIAMSKSMEAQLGLSCTIGAQGGRGQATKQLDSLTGLWEKLDAHLGAEAREREAQRSSTASLSASASASASAAESDPSHDINTSLQALELYFYLGHAFFQRGDDSNAIDNLQRVISVARHNPETLSAGLDRELRMPSAEEDSNEKHEEESKQSHDGESANQGASSFPHPSSIHYPRMMLLVESSMLLAVALARASQHAEALEAFRVAQRMLTNLKRFNVLAKGYWEAKWREPQPLPRSTSAPADAPVQFAPIPTHEATDSTHVSHTAIDLALQALQDREHAYHFNVFVCYSFEKLASFCARGLLQVARESALLHLAQAQYEEAARCQEEVCTMLEHDDGADADDPEAANWTARALAQDAEGNVAPTNSPVTGLYQLDVAKAYRRLGDIYSAAVQPRTAKAAYSTALSILQILYGVKKVHSVTVQHARHSSYSSIALRPKSPTRASAASVAAKAGGLASPPVLSSFEVGPPPLTAMSPSQQIGAEHALPAPIYKLLSALRLSIRQMREEIRNEGLIKPEQGQEAGAEQDGVAADASADPATAAAHSTDVYVADGFDQSPSASSTQIEQRRERSPPRSSKTASNHLHHGATKRARAALKARQLNDYTPISPHVGRRFNSNIGDQLSGESSVIRESLGLRLAAAPEDEANRSAGAGGASAYDSFIVEKQAAREALRKANLAQAEAQAKVAAMDDNYDDEEVESQSTTTEEDTRARLQRHHIRSDSTEEQSSS